MTVNATELLAEPTRLELLQRTIAAKGEQQDALARLLCVTTQRDALARGLTLLKLELAREEYQHGEIPLGVVRTFIDETIRGACEREGRAAARIARLACGPPAPAESLEDAYANSGHAAMGQHHFR